MAGLPKKYAKMGFKKGWREYRKVHKKKGTKRKTASPRSSKKRNPKRRTTKRKTQRRRSNPGGKKVSTRKKNTQGDMNMGHAAGGPAIQRFLEAMESGSGDPVTQGIPNDYTGYLPRDKNFDVTRLARGWGGTVNEIGYRKIAKALHTTPYPSKNSFLEMIAYYGKPAMDAWENQGDIQEAHRQIYKDLHGVDLSASGFDAYQPLEMLDTKGTLLLVKLIKKYVREAGVTLPKWV